MFDWLGLYGVPLQIRQRFTAMWRVDGASVKIKQPLSHSLFVHEMDGCGCVAACLVCRVAVLCYVCVSLVPLCPHVLFCDVWFVCVSSEGKMVVLSLAIGLAEQDDFANLPDLQEAPASKENETTPEKR